jgi:alpha-ketoglutaric semialdehyde dehydrogenase
VVTMDTLYLKSTGEVDNFLSNANQAHLKSRGKFASRSRVEAFLKGVDVVDSKRDLINRKVMEETGKSQALANSEFDAALSFARQTAYACFATVGATINSAVEGKYVSVDRVPFGPAVLISSYNTPLPNLFWKLAPSYLAGNISLICPSAHVAGSAALVLECLFEGGVPQDQASLTDGAIASAEAAVKSRFTKLISFTGSNRVGQIIARDSAQHHPKLILELGGTNPLIVLPSANLLLAAEAALLSAFSNGGQRCAAGSIALVQDSVYEEFSEILGDKLTSPDFLAKITEINTPLVSPEARAAHQDFLARAMQQGANAEYLDTDDSGSSSVPVILSGFRDALVACSSEVFSPILRMVKFSQAQDAATFANSLPLRLTSAVWTDRNSELNFFRERLDFGLINFNGPTFGAEPNFPFGGMGGSGNGSRDAGFNALESYSQSMIWTMVRDEND